jgi:hypothetical protein
MLACARHNLSLYVFLLAEGFNLIENCFHERRPLKGRLFYFRIFYRFAY